MRVRQDTREQLINAAQYMFASKGYYGASLSGIAARLSLTKQGLLHHFRSKEKIYAEVLLRISQQALGIVQEARAANEGPEERLGQAFAGLYRWMIEDKSSAQILMRELLDNQQRAEQTSNWGFFNPLLDELVSIVTDGRQGNHSTREPPLAFVYQMVGAHHYFAVSMPSLQNMLGAEEYRQLEHYYPRELQRQIRSYLKGRQEAAL